MFKLLNGVFMHNVVVWFDFRCVFSGWISEVCLLLVFCACGTFGSSFCLCFGFLLVSNVFFFLVIVIVLAVVVIYNASNVLAFQVLGL